MRKRFNICDFYLIIVLLISLKGVLYEGGGYISKGLLFLFVALSIYYCIYANINYKLPLYFKALNVLLLLFTIYGVLLLLNGEVLYVQMRGVKAIKIEYLLGIYRSLLPAYAFYFFGREGMLTENKLRIWFLVFLILTIFSYYQRRFYLLSLNESIEEVTNNQGYAFVGLLPAVLLFRKKIALQYVLLFACCFFVVSSMKRGAILCAAICLIWFLSKSYWLVNRNRRWIILLMGLFFFIAGFVFINYMLDNSSYFVYRIEQTQEMNTSYRDNLFSLYLNHFIQEDNTIRFLFGNGTWATLKIGDNFAHNDWLEIAIGQGLLGLVVFLYYWVCYYKTWRGLKNNKDAFTAVGMLFFIYFVRTFFSMSYSNVSICSSMVLGYYLTSNSNWRESGVSLQTKNSSEKIALLNGQ